MNDRSKINGLFRTIDSLPGTVSDGARAFRDRLFAAHCKKFFLFSKVTVLTGGLKHIKCAEDDDFMAAFDKMMQDTFQVNTYVLGIID